MDGETLPLPANTESEKTGRLRPETAAGIIADIGSQPHRAVADCEDSGTGLHTGEAGR